MELQQKAQGGASSGTSAFLQARFPADKVPAAGELLCDYLIIARGAENRIWLKDSAHPGLRLARHWILDLGLAVLPGALGPQCSLSPFWALSGLALTGGGGGGFVRPAIRVFHVLSPN